MSIRAVLRGGLGRMRRDTKNADEVFSSGRLSGERTERSRSAAEP